MRRAYLAGPDIFLPDAAKRVADQKAICARYGLVGVSPLDPATEEHADLPEWRRIAMHNEALIHSCDILLANLTPFRGPSADVGTVYELALMRALGRPVFGYATTATDFTRRTLDFVSGRGGAIAGADRSWRDSDGMLVEQFGRFDNLMVDAGVAASGGRLIVAEIDPVARWTDLSVFERCVAAAAAPLDA
jgi:nucleoside 2-deoxyribosyltransferase